MDIEALILEDIINGVYSPDERLNISLLKKKYGVGLAPLRETLARLTATNLLINVNNRGFFVAPISSEDYYGVYETFAYLEQLAIRQAIKNGSETWEEAIAGALYRLKKLELATTPPNFEEWFQANLNFHEKLIQGCNPVVMELRQQLFFRMIRYVRLSYYFDVDNLKEHSKDHERLADAIIARKADEATELIYQHIMNAVEMLHSKIKEQYEI